MTWAQCGELAEALAEDMAREALRGRTLTLKLKTSAFEARARLDRVPEPGGDLFRF